MKDEKLYDFWGLPKQSFKGREGEGGAHKKTI